jgi:hypothetical protein
VLVDGSYAKREREMVRLLEFGLSGRDGCFGGLSRGESSCGEFSRGEFVGADRLGGITAG